MVFADNAVEERIAAEKKLQSNVFSLTPHKPNYLLPFVYNDKIDSYNIYSEGDNGENEAQNVELQFQISFKIPVWKDKTKTIWVLSWKTKLSN